MQNPPCCNFRTLVFSLEKWWCMEEQYTSWNCFRNQSFISIEFKEQCKVQAKAITEQFQKSYCIYVVQEVCGNIRCTDIAFGAKPGGINIARPCGAIIASAELAMFSDGTSSTKLLQALTICSSTLCRLEKPLQQSQCRSQRFRMYRKRSLMRQ